MPDSGILGAKVKALRRREAMTQVQLAERLGISPSYLNLIENNRRALTAPLLIRLAEIFQLDVKQFGGGDDARLASDLMEVFGDPLFERHPLTNADVRELAMTAPNVARAVLTLYRAWQGAQESVQTLASRVSDGEELTNLDRSRLPSEEVSDLIQARQNHFPELEERAEALWRDAQLTPDDLYRGLVRYLESAHGITVEVVKAGRDRRAVRRFDPERRLLTLSELLPPRSRNFQLAHQLALLTQRDTLDALLREGELSTPDSHALARVALANYFAGAVLMPYAPMLEAARAERYDIELLGHRFRTSFEQVCQRLTTLRRPGAEGVPFHMLRIDVAGNISKRFSASGIRFARFSGACPRWNVHAAFMTPGMIRIQLSRMPDGNVYFCLARTVRKDSGGYHAIHTVHAIGLGCRVEHARELIYSDGVDLSNLDAAVPVGVTCRMCDRMDCEQRVHPALQHPLKVDENVRGVNFYTPVTEE
ncbi:MAG: short-chain fatty acyl-CoA regulator family protein [Myxococcales bacterium]